MCQTLATMQLRYVFAVLAGCSLSGLGVFAGNAQTAVPSQKPPATTAPAASPALIAQGKTVYNSLDCNTCHVIGNVGTVVGPDLSHIGKTWSQTKLTTMIRNPKKIMPKGYMPAYGTKKVSSQQLKTMAAYLNSLK